mmetsp:Transcript_7233/g.22132  ORF Transcript_7233/g.22132 Transcript_7233/m.22132 type:complete len:285 (+) Transcript_7233:147-1001(+)
MHPHPGGDGTRVRRAPFCLGKTRPLHVAPHARAELASGASGLRGLAWRGGAPGAAGLRGVPCLGRRRRHGLGPKRTTSAFRRRRRPQQGTRAGRGHVLGGLAQHGRLPGARGLPLGPRALGGGLGWCTPALPSCPILGPERTLPGARKAWGVHAGRSGRACHRLPALGGPLVQLEGRTAAQGDREPRRVGCRHSSVRQPLARPLCAAPLRLLLQACSLPRDASPWCTSGCAAGPAKGGRRQGPWPSWACRASVDSGMGRRAECSGSSQSMPMGLAHARPDSAGE